MAVDLAGCDAEDVGVHAVTADSALVLQVPATGMLGRRAGIPR